MQDTANFRIIVMIKIKRIYEAPESEDGYRMLVDRLWPRGLSKADAALNEWNKDIAPSTELRKSFAHKAELFETFSQQYKKELEGKITELHRIKNIALFENLTLLYAARDQNQNNAQVLLEMLHQIK